MSYSINVNKTFVELVCCTCGVDFAMVDDLHNHRLADGKDFYCSNGHCQHFTNSMQSKLDKAMSQLNLERDQRMAAERERDKIKQRIAGGTCPCCKRHFDNLQRHMAAKHKKYTA